MEEPQDLDKMVQQILVVIWLCFPFAFLYRALILHGTSKLFYPVLFHFLIVHFGNVFWGNSACLA